MYIYGAGNGCKPVWNSIYKGIEGISTTFAFLILMQTHIFEVSKACIHTN